MNLQLQQSQLNYRIAGTVAIMLMVALSVTAFLSPEIKKPEYQYAIVGAATFAILFIVFKVSERVVFMPSGIQHKRWLFGWRTKTFNWSDIESLHMHYATMKAADKSHIYLLKLNFKSKETVKAIFRSEERVIGALRFMRERNNTFPVGYSKSNREVSFVLRKAGVVRN
jgi:hypothetical protein